MEGKEGDGEAGVAVQKDGPCHCQRPNGPRKGVESQPCRTPEAGFLSVPILVTSIHVVVLGAVVQMTNLRLGQGVSL